MRNLAFTAAKATLGCIQHQPFKALKTLHFHLYFFKNTQEYCRLSARKFCNCLWITLWEKREVQSCKASSWCFHLLFFSCLVFFFFVTWKYAFRAFLKSWIHCITQTNNKGPFFSVCWHQHDLKYGPQHILLHKCVSDFDEEYSGTTEERFVPFNLSRSPMSSVEANTKRLATDRGAVSHSWYFI